MAEGWRNPFRKPPEGYQLKVNLSPCSSYTATCERHPASEGQGGTRAWGAGHRARWSWGQVSPGESDCADPGLLSLLRPSQARVLVGKEQGAREDGCARRDRQGSRHPHGLQARGAESRTLNTSRGLILCLPPKKPHTKTKHTQNRTKATQKDTGHRQR